jgi:hypothetical protein
LYRILALALLMPALSSVRPAWADQTQVDKDQSLDDALISSMKITEPAKHKSSSYDQMVTFGISEFKPKALSFSNGTYGFNYGGSPDSVLGSVGWAIKLFGGMGAMYLEENFGFTTLNGDVSQSQGVKLSANNYSLYMFAFDTRLMYAGDWFPWKRLVPFIDGGYQYAIYYQPASSGLESAQGGVANPVAGLGLRFWLNRDSSLAVGRTPVFLIAKANRVFNADNSVNLAQTSVMGGLAIGL